MARYLNILAIGMLVVPTSAFPQDEPDPPKPENEIVVTAERPPPRCRPRSDDPLNQIQLDAPKGYWVRIEPSPDGAGFQYVGYTWHRAPESSLTEAGAWRRAGNALPKFNFREPRENLLMCVGRKEGTMGGDAQFQQLLLPHEYLCKSVRFTAFAASRKANAIFWLNGRESDHFNSGKAMQAGFRGDNGWTPILIEENVIPFNAPSIGFGVIVDDGDVWLFDAKLSIVPDTELTERERRKQDGCLERARKHCSRVGDGAGDLGRRCRAIQGQT